MKNFELAYGSSKVKVSIEEKNLLGVIESKPFTVSEAEDEIIQYALQNPKEKGQQFKNLCYASCCK